MLGASLTDPDLRAKYPRESYFLTTKVGRISAETFDYSPAWVRQSVSRSISRLGAGGWLDLVLCHDVEFVSAAEVLGAIAALRELRELREPRDDGTTAVPVPTVRYVGISGYPLGVLCDLAELVLRETGEPLDAVMSYANFTLQNTRLHTAAAARFKAAGVAVVLNASPLGMGLLRTNGVPVGTMGDWHPAPAGLREACARAAEFCEKQQQQQITSSSNGSNSNSNSNSGGSGGSYEPLEKVALRYALEEWMRVGGGGEAGLGTTAPFGKTQSEQPKPKPKPKGVSVCGVSYLHELTDTLDVFRSVLRAADADADTDADAGAEEEERRRRSKTRKQLVEGIRGVLGPWVDYAWDSPGKDFVRKELEN